MHVDSSQTAPSLAIRFPKHRVTVSNDYDVSRGDVRWSPVKSIWFISMLLAAVVGGIATFTWSAFALFVISTLFVLLFGHSLGSHRKLIHNSFQCPRWLEYALIYCGLQVGLAGPLGLLRQHELRDFAQRLPHCHDYLRHGSGPWRDAWWQLNCELRLTNEPNIEIESRIADDPIIRFFERTWMLQHVFVAVLFYLWGGWAFVFWGVCARVTAGVFGHWLIGYFAHNHGPMNYEIRGAAVQGHNIRWTSLITMGECWHNNHHAYPGSARLGLARGEWDPGWWMLRVFECIGLAWDFRLPKDLAPREELIPLHANEPLRTADYFDLTIARQHNAENKTL
jgi:fatty-acid desaturase